MPAPVEVRSPYIRYPKRMRRGNLVRWRHDGSEGLSAMLAAIRHAKTTILMEFYIFRDDSIGRVFADALADKARSGVAVHLMVDAWGNLDVDSNFYEEMRAAGVEVCEYRPLTLWNAFQGPGRRNHRKVLVVDMSVGFIGGLNIASDYGSIGQGGAGWRDTLSEVQGPVVYDLVRLLLNSRAKSCTAQNTYARPESPTAGTDGVRAALLTNSARGQRHRIRRSYLKAIGAAQETIIIANAYFLPGRAIRSALERATRRGVQVQVLLPKYSDVPVVGWASRYLFTRMLRRGIEIYEWTDSMLHAKVAVVDGAWATVGSYNLDQRSLRTNLEANLVVLDSELGHELQTDLTRDIARSQRVSLTQWNQRSFIERVRDWFFYQFRSFM